MTPPARGAGARARTQPVAHDLDEPGAGVPELRLRFKRHPDGSASLTGTRRDGTTTWQRQRGGVAMVLPPHDLTHYAVETTLGMRRGFYGLLADGWDIADFAAPWPRGTPPAEALEVELVVGFFDADRRQGDQWTAEEFARHAATYVAARKAARHAPMPQPRALTQGEIDAVRRCRDALLAAWRAVPAGGELSLAFTRAGAG